MNIVKTSCQVHCEDVERTEKVVILQAVKATSSGIVRAGVYGGLIIEH